MMTSGMFRISGIAVAVAALILAGCDSGDPAARQEMTKVGVSDAAASELSKMQLTPEEILSIAEAKKAGLDDASITRIVKSVHERELKFDLGFNLQLLMQQGMGPTVLVELAEMGALPGWASDISALKDINVSDVTILQLAKLRFQEKKALLSGNEYASLKRFGLSDAGLLAFAQKGGTYQQVQELTKELALGKPEQEAMKAVGL